MNWIAILAVVAVPGVVIVVALVALVSDFVRRKKEADQRRRTLGTVLDFVAAAIALYWTDESEQKLRQDLSKQDESMVSLPNGHVYWQPMRVRLHVKHTENDVPLYEIDVDCLLRGQPRWITGYNTSLLWIPGYRFAARRAIQRLLDPCRFTGKIEVRGLSASDDRCLIWIGGADGECGTSFLVAGTWTEDMIPRLALWAKELKEEARRRREAEEWAAKQRRYVRKTEGCQCDPALERVREHHARHRPWGRAWNPDEDPRR